MKWRGEKENKKEAHNPKFGYEYERLQSSVQSEKDLN
jgi:hypothetical protein